MTRVSEPRTLWVDTDRFALYREGSSLLLREPGRAPTRVPLRRVGRAVIRGRGHSAELLDACLALAAAGSVVHFPQPGSRPALRLQSECLTQEDTARELASLIHQHSSLAPFRWWADVQRRHAWSVIYHRSYRGDFAAARARLVCYLEHGMPAGMDAHREVVELEEELHHWLGAELHRRGWESVVHALAARGARIETILIECLSIPLLWRFTCWRRQKPGQLDARERARFLELESVGRLDEQLHRHLRALSSEYYATCRRLSEGSARDNG